MLSYLLKSSPDGDRSSLARRWASRFSLIGDHDLRYPFSMLTKFFLEQDTGYSNQGMGNKTVTNRLKLPIVPVTPYHKYDKE